MSETAPDLSDIEWKAFEAVQTALSKYVKSDRLKPVRNVKDDYFSIKLDDTDDKKGKEVCYIKHDKKDGSLTYIGFPNVEYDISSNDISSHKDKLLYKLIDMASKNDIPLPLPTT